jgi:hypothetical protein
MFVRNARLWIIKNECQISVYELFLLCLPLDVCLFMFVFVCVCVLCLIFEFSLRV